MIYSFFIENNIKNFKTNLINECLAQRNLEQDCNNFKLNTMYLHNLYKLFITNAKKVLNKFTLKDKDFKIWCYITDKSYSDTHWHNHKKSATINCVIYLKTNNKGIDFIVNNKKKYLKPKDGDMLIFPASLDHCPQPATDKKRISLNLEIRCNENEQEIFNVS